MNILENKIAIVTGGTRGIGRAIAQRLLQEGVRVAVCGTKAESVATALAVLSGIGETFGMVADVSKPDQVKLLVNAVRRRFGTIHILINNAGAGYFRSVADLQPADWERLIALNLSAAYYCSHEILPIFKTEGSGDVINIGSLAGVNSFAGGAGYNASKFGLLGFSEAMMLDHRQDGIRVSCIMPGSVDTEFSGKPGPSTGWKIAPEDVADAVLAVLRMPRRTTISRVDIHPTRPQKK